MVVPSRTAAWNRRGRGQARFGDSEPLQKHQCRLAATVRHRAGQEFACGREIAVSIGLETAVQQFVRLPLSLGKRATRPLDVRAGAPVAALEKRHPGPDVDCLFVLSFEIVVQAGKEKPLDQRIAIRLSGSITGRRGAQRLGHLGQMSTEARLL